MIRKDLHIRIDQAVYHRLQIYSKKKSISITLAVEEIINQFLKNEQWNNNSPELLTMIQSLINHENNNTKILKSILKSNMENISKLDILLNNEEYDLDISELDNELNKIRERNDEYE